MIVPTNAIGEITQVYGDGFVAIKPLGSIKGVEFEPIPRVPMCQLGNSEFSQVFPFKVGDVVPIAFLMFSQSNYLMGNDTGDLDSDMTNEMGDCIAFPFKIPSISNPVTGESDTISTSGNIKQNGTVTATDCITESGISLDTHVHGGVTKGGDKTTVPE